MSQGDSNPAAIPHAAEDIQGDDRWMSQHNRFVLDCKDKEPDVLFVGDSMVQLMQQYEIWRELFSPLHALNFGIGGDTTRHVLWRLKNGELENIKPKVIVVWVGTNNHENTAEEVAGGIEAIVQLINTRQPQAKIIVLGKAAASKYSISEIVRLEQGSVNWSIGTYPDDTPATTRPAILQLFTGKMSRITMKEKSRWTEEILH
ncbi:platelet-activating factor acetylhydrolase IB subunit alpha2 isoform b [Homo sapiens]|uniref:Isoform 4 of Platelet-activating factor acetylhydrolase IB subunit alpha2 n=1 Tax=Homo sapiens TaxID=9606 RepID=P68402-4|nr:platelet-activating factor acetylhydrolase IB subunit alpha2 isoform b [Homo sapiens]|eukprot:NP_001171675.1 platelet-activating factor acetylhydrolase IB subunit beta isoform b [Homo sapiens]